MNSSHWIRIRRTCPALCALCCATFAYGAEPAKSAGALAPTAAFATAIASAERGLGETKIPRVADGLQWLRELSTKPNIEDSFHTVDVCRLAERLQLWNRHLPSVSPHYAIKTNHDPIVVRVMAGLGTGFDCASQGEIAQVLALGVAPDKIIFAHPRKPIGAIRFAHGAGVYKMVFDSSEELDKMMLHAPNGQFVLRIKTDDSHSANPLSSKFGASMKDAHAILDAAFAKHARVVGVAFHVGSNCTDVDSYRKALLDAAVLFRYAESKWHHRLTILDLGGGWPGTDDAAFVAIARTVEGILRTDFASNVQVFAEPGRYFAAQTTSVARRILGKSTTADGPAGRQVAYYLANGVFGLFISSMYYNFDSKQILSEGWDFQPLQTPAKAEPRYRSVLWGPTCDSGDKILNDALLPELDSGSFIYSHNVGAYSVSLQTEFNRIPSSTPYYGCVNRP